MSVISDENARTRLLLGEDGLCKLQNSRVAVFGIGGVGSYTAEALARAGVGHLTLIDNDTVSLSNINRQLYALHSTVGRLKVEVAEERLRDINPGISIETHALFFTPETADSLDLSSYDYIVDAIDTVSAKIYLAVFCEQQNIPLISSMGTGNKFDPTRFEVTDIYKTSVCPLARVMRNELKKRGVRHLRVLYSQETPLKPHDKNAETKGDTAHIAPGSLSFVPSAAGLIIAGEVIRSLAGLQ